MAERDEKIAELERQIADATKAVEPAEAMARQIEELRATSDNERCELELKLMGVRSVTAAKELLTEHDGDVAELKNTEPWLSVETTPTGEGIGLSPQVPPKYPTKT